MSTCLAETDMHRATVQLRGELDIATLGRVRRALTRAIAASSTQTVVVDLGAVTFLDAVTVGALIDLQAEAHAVGRQLVFRGVSPKLDRVLRLLGVESEFEVVT